MKVAVLIAGVHDPKWPVTPSAALGEEAGDQHRIMSPFDEAALEMALRLRDADPAVQIAAIVGGGAAGIKVARTVAALNVADVGTLALDRPWDQVATARALAGFCEDADLILIGREYGDFDDGLVPSLLAGVLALPFFGRAQTIETQGGVRLMRERGSSIERLACTGRLVASVTNDRRTRLRKPLMKNVMQARQAVIAEASATGEPSPALVLHELSQRTSGRERTNCTLYAGTAAEQARALADLLWEARA